MRIPCAVLALVGLIVRLAGGAEAFSITIDPNGYEGAYQVQTLGSFFGPAPRTVELGAGTYLLGLEGFSTYNSSPEGEGFFRFTVDASGSISEILHGTTVGTSSAATANGSTLTFSTVTINIDPGYYKGAYVTAPHRNVGTFAGPGITPVTLVREITYDLGFPGFETVSESGANGAAFIRVSVASTGLISRVANGANGAPSNAASAAGNTLTFANASIEVEPREYKGVYTTIAHRSIGVGYFQDDATIVLVPEISYFIDNTNGGFGTFSAGGASGATFFVISLGATGSITHVLNAVTHLPSGAAVASGATLTFNNSSIRFAAGDYTGRYVMTSFRPLTPAYFEGPGDIVLVPDLSYQIDFASGAFATYVVGGATVATFLGFTVNPGGDVSTAFNVFDNSPTLAMTPSAKTITFNPVPVEVDPTAYTGLYEVSGYTGKSGLECLQLLRTLAGMVRTPVDLAAFYVEANGAATPASVQLDTGSGEATFGLSTCVRTNGPITVWLGLKNSDDEGTQFDVLVEVFRNSVLAASGIAQCVTGLKRNPAAAKMVTVSFPPATSVPLGPTDTIDLKVSTRIGTTASGAKCSGPGGSHNSALALRLYYDGSSRQSRLAVEDPGDDLYLRSNGSACPAGSAPSPGVTNLFLDPAAPTATAAKCKDSGVVTYSGGNPYSEVGTWKVVMP